MCVEESEGNIVAKSKSPKPSGPTEDKDKVAVDVTEEKPDTQPAEISDNAPEDKDEGVVLSEPGTRESDVETDTQEQIADTPQPDVEGTDAEIEAVETAGVETTSQDEEPIADYVTPDDSTPVVATRAPEAERKSGGFWPLFLGGVVAALLGFVAGKTEVMDQFIPPSWRSTAENVETTDRLASMDQTVSQLRGEIDELRGQIPGAPEDNSEALNGFTTSMNALSASVDELETRVSALEQRPEPAPDASPNVNVEALTDEMQAQQAQIDKLLEDAQNMQASAAAAANTTLARAAATRVLSAVDSGSPFATALSDVSANSDVEIPQALGSAADDGVTTLSELQQTLPEAARSALAAARTNATDENGGFGGFLRQQLGARSVEPRAGDDPDAVLSRMEEAVRQGRLADALTEAEALSDPAKAELQSWMDAAQARLEATNAAEALIQRLAAN